MNLTVGTSLTWIICVLGGGFMLFALIMCWYVRAEQRMRDNTIWYDSERRLILADGSIRDFQLGLRPDGSTVWRPMVRK